MDREKLIQLRWLLMQWRDSQEKERKVDDPHDRYMYLSVEIDYIDEDIKDLEARE